MQHPEKKIESLNYNGAIGQTVNARGLQLDNLMIQQNTFNSDGNWAFCRFDHEAIYAARIGFQRGAFDFTDFGHDPKDSFLQLHIELMTRDGAHIWIATGKYSQEQVNYAAKKMDVSLVDAGHSIFQIRGWPTMKWSFCTDDDLLKIDVNLELAHSTIFPDYTLPNNIFSMCISVGSIRGKVWLNNQSSEVSGSVFYDHSRVVVRKNNVQRPKWNLYTPLSSNDGSFLVSLYSENNDGNKIENYSCGNYIDQFGKSYWLPEIRLEDIKFDLDGHPSYWKQSLESADIKVMSEVHVRPTYVQKSWGNPNSRQLRKDNMGIGLVLDGTVEIELSNGEKTTKRTMGLAEHYNLQ